MAIKLGERKILFKKMFSFIKKIEVNNCNNEI